MYGYFWPLSPSWSSPSSSSGPRFERLAISAVTQRPLVRMKAVSWVPNVPRRRGDESKELSWEIVRAFPDASSWRWSPQPSRRKPLRRQLISPTPSTRAKGATAAVDTNFNSPARALRLIVRSPVSRHFHVALSHDISMSQQHAASHILTRRPRRHRLRGMAMNRVERREPSVLLGNRE
jgi:hypothetical protein